MREFTDTLKYYLTRDREVECNIDMLSFQDEFADEVDLPTRENLARLAVGKEPIKKKKLNMSKVKLWASSNNASIEYNEMNNSIVFKNNGKNNS